MAVLYTKRYLQIAEIFDTKLYTKEDSKVLLDMGMEQALDSFFDMNKRYGMEHMIEYDWYRLLRECLCSEHLHWTQSFRKKRNISSWNAPDQVTWTEFKTAFSTH